MNRETVKRLAIQCGAELALLDNNDLYLIETHELQAFALAIIENYKAGLVLIGWTITDPDGVTINNDEVPDFTYYTQEEAIEWRDSYCYKTCNVLPIYALPPLPINDKETV